LSSKKVKFFFHYFMLFLGCGWFHWFYFLLKELRVNVGRFLFSWNGRLSLSDQSSHRKQTNETFTFISHLSGITVLRWLVWRSWILAIVSHISSIFV
jgi:hypothetical protein